MTVFFNLYFIKQVNLFALLLHVAQDSTAFHIPRIVNIPDANHIPKTVYVQLKINTYLNHI